VNGRFALINFFLTKRFTVENGRWSLVIGHWLLVAGYFRLYQRIFSADERRTTNNRISKKTPNGAGVF